MLLCFYYQIMMRIVLLTDIWVFLVKMWRRWEKTCKKLYRLTPDQHLFIFSDLKVIIFSLVKQRYLQTGIVVKKSHPVQYAFTLRLLAQESRLTWFVAGKRIIFDRDTQCLAPCAIDIDKWTAIKVARSSVKVMWVVWTVIRRPADIYSDSVRSSFS